jgi:hypothetical protein
MKELGVDEAVESQTLKRAQHIVYITETRKSCIILVTKVLTKQSPGEYKRRRVIYCDAYAVGTTACVDNRCYGNG